MCLTIPWIGYAFLKIKNLFKGRIERFENKTMKKKTNIPENANKNLKKM